MEGDLTRLVFVVPAFRRFELSRVCLRQLARTCSELAVDYAIRATAVVVADDENLRVAEGLGFATVRQENRPFGRKWNDGIEYACRELGADYVVPFGTDNWVSTATVARLPKPGMIGARRLVTLVHEHGNRMVPLRVSYAGGDGIRTIPAGVLESTGFRPAEESRPRAIDTSIWNSLRVAHGSAPEFDYHDVHPLQIVGFQSEDEQLNEYRGLRAVFAAGEERFDVWDALAQRFPREAVEEARDVFRARGLARERARPMVVVGL